jgi:hypothetical protein
MRRAMGVAVFWGMLGVTFFGLLLMPAAKFSPYSPKDTYRLKPNTLMKSNACLVWQRNPCIRITESFRREVFDEPQV